MGHSLGGMMRDWSAMRSRPVAPGVATAGIWAVGVTHWIGVAIEVGEVSKMS
jgi:hypothetical protein